MFININIKTCKYLTLDAKKKKKSINMPAPHAYTPPKY